MKKFLLLIVIGIVLFMPSGVEAKEYTIKDFNTVSTLTIDMNVGDSIDYDLSRDVIPLRLINIFDVDYSLIDTIDTVGYDRYRYTIKSY